MSDQRPDADRLLTARQLGEYLGLSTATVLDRFEAGSLPGFRLWGKKGGPVRFRLAEVEAQIEGWRVSPTNPIASPVSDTTMRRIRGA